MDLSDTRQWKNSMNNIIKTCIAIICILTFSGCTISHEYGPYMGKVVDKETDEPIEGAVVFIRFSTETIGPRTEYADAVEVLTDKNGEFEIPLYNANAFRFLHSWNDHCSVIVFKPGYGAYPGHKKTSLSEWDEDGYFPENRYVTIMIPKLKTIDERVKNLGNVTSYRITEIPSEKQNIIMRLNDEESVDLGLSPRIKSSKRGN